MIYSDAAICCTNPAERGGFANLIISLLFDSKCGIFGYIKKGILIV